MSILHTTDLDNLTDVDRQGLLWLDHAERLERQRLAAGPYLTNEGRTAIDAEMFPRG